MKHFSLFVLTSLLITACTPANNTPTARDGAKEGEFCGGIAGILCEDGLTCEYEGRYPDAGGTCRRS